MASKEKETLAHLKAAQAQAELSNARRLKVGAVLVKDGRIISNGRNGMPSGGSNNCETLEQEGPTTEWVTKPEVIHAEANVIAFAAKNGVSTDSCSMIITHSPCFECAKLIIQTGIKEVFFKEEYRITDSIDFLKRYKITIERINDVW